MRDPEPAREAWQSIRSLPLAQREVALLAVLCVISAAMFVGTHQLASWSRDRRGQAAAEWFARGEQLASAGDLNASITALKEAVAADRQNPHYALALAHSLAGAGGAGRNDEAQSILLQLRQGEPDDVEVNYRLARLAAMSDDSASTIRYYNYAMYGLARIGPDRDRAAIRIELITFLLAQGGREEAVAELGALDRELPDVPQAHLQAARLDVQAGETKSAFDHFEKAGALDARSVAAATGAGAAAFALHDFKSTVRDLGRAIALGAGGSDVHAELETARLVLANDPLSPDVSTSERTRRLLAGLQRAAAAYDVCIGTTTAIPPAPGSARAELDHLIRRPHAALQDPDVRFQAVELIGGVESTIRGHCPSSMTTVDQAWALIASLHQGHGA